MKRTEWFKRKFPVMDDNGLLPSIIERLSGTPVRIEEIAGSLDTDLLTLKRPGKWSIKEEIGHLGDMEPLWAGRIDDLSNGLAELRTADLTNQATHTADHNSAKTIMLLQRFRQEREALVHKLFALTDGQLERTALHPRLKTPMRVIDLAYFVAEHDDHHLASVREIINSATGHI
ncbi:DinB family protein [Chitinophaga rhizophila]|uniref:DinB family protein n=1 Tax=Chitinophaga rhizophila TaxID=2866212 RepID=A0ABS7GKS4_9BACT|nr:DinB family protein [Chitinophaga rhizophila]MBW8688329.1 DinB family protein [Chitinophaga rhizophila]